MSFPSTKDIQRLIDMQTSDCGFFVLAIYAFIEKYMKSEISYFENIEDNDDKFHNLIYKYVKALKKSCGWVSDKDHDFLFSMKIGKKNANRVRHEFLPLGVEDARVAIKDLLQFCSISDQSMREQFEPLNLQLSEWIQRRPPAETAQELLEANNKIAQMQKNLPNIIKESSEYLEIKNELDKIKKRCEFFEIEKNQSEQMASKFQQELENLEKKQKEAQERFNQYESYISNLQRMLAYTRTRNDFEHSILRLTAEQQEAVDRIKFRKDYLIKGSAGTGKSLVLLKAVEKLINETKSDKDKPKVTFVTFTKSLVKYNAYVAKLMEMGIAEENIKTADSFFKEIMDEVIPGHHINYAEQGSNNYKKMILEIITQDYSDKDILADDIFNEAVTFIWPNMITKEEYLDKMIDRTGLKSALKHDQRIIYWDIISKLEEKLNQEKTWIPDYARLQVARHLKEQDVSTNTEAKKFTDYLFIDEGQDLSICLMFCLKAICKTSVVMARDKDQTIYQLHSPLSRSGINITGNSVSLKTNFRNTIQINDVAETYRKLIKGMSKDSNPSSFRMGPPVELIDLDKETNSDQDLYELIAQRVRIYMNELEYAAENICIILNDARNNKTNQVISALKKLGIPAENIKDKDYAVGGKVNISTIQSCKGLDFPIVIMLADHRAHFNDSKYDEETVERLQRNMFYVAMTRAMDMLTVITWNNSQTPVINDIKKCILDTQKKASRKT